MINAAATAGEIAASSQAIRLGLGLSSLPPTLVILGSGFKDFESQVTDSESMEMVQVPHFPVPAVDGHGGKLLVGKVDGHPVTVLTGRVHLYEGHSADRVVFPLRVLATLGIKRLLITNAAGSLASNLPPGEVVLLQDQINFTGTSCLMPGGQTFGPLFVDMSAAFDRTWGEKIKAFGPRLRRGAVREGVYAGVLGPAYETPAEARMLARLGADMVGMSTVQEVLAARQLGLSVAALSFITNWSGGLGEALKHTDVLALVLQHKYELRALLCHAIGV